VRIFDLINERVPAEFFRLSLGKAGQLKVEASEELRLREQIESPVLLSLLPFTDRTAMITD
jgi:hypothetical protein